jgi:hypothetical protein
MKVRTQPLARRFFNTVFASVLTWESSAMVHDPYAGIVVDAQETVLTT